MAKHSLVIVGKVPPAKAKTIGKYRARSLR